MLCLAQDSLPITSKSYQSLHIENSIFSKQSKNENLKKGFSEIQFLNSPMSPRTGPPSIPFVIKIQLLECMMKLATAKLMTNLLAGVRRVLNRPYKKIIMLFPVTEMTKRIAMRLTKQIVMMRLGKPNSRT